MVALWKEGWAQGSLEVGMLRDSRAIACFGSRVEVVDVEGDDGDDVGDGAGGSGRETDVTMGVESRRRRRTTMRAGERARGGGGGGGFMVVVCQEHMRL